MRGFEIDQFVWISSKDISLVIKTFLHDANIPFWLGRITKPPSDTSSKYEKTHHLVRLCGTIHRLWVLEESIHHLSDEMFRDAAGSFILKTLFEVIEAGGLFHPKPKSSTKDSLKNNVSIKNCTAVHTQNPEDVTEIPSIRDGEFPETFRTTALCWKIKHASEKAKHASEKTVKKTPRKRKLAEDELDQSPMQKLSMASDDHSEQNSITNQSEVNQPADDPFAARGEYIPFHFLREPYLQVRGPTSQKIGFIGLGVMAQRIVKNLLKSGHDVSIWNRTEDKCRNLVEDGAQQCSTPSQLIRECDIIFSCVSDPGDVKSNLFFDKGVLEGLKNCEPGTKGYVELTSTDPTTSREHAEAIMYNGGKYLEAPMCGLERLAEDGSLLIICSGDPGLFKSCRSCFSAFCRDLLYLNNNIGIVSKLRLAVSMLVGNVYASLIESMAFLKRCRISRNVFLRILELISMSSPFIKVVGESILEEKFSTDISLKNQQQDLSWALIEANSMDIPMTMTHTANERYKYAKFLCKTGGDLSFNFFR
ncbi:putative oxidoreductase GLYR1 homolog [Trichonephila clavata]|uniref:Putative oxidoreductase GLYR1 homolog n=1 Tax=Trichonephila clavata TaxID=2740835 RepID=A0A8X6FQT9_TRICU|nr:putative oxidoreductase GLYR1 homolog [Trichonephila clavata]